VAAEGIAVACVALLAGHVGLGDASGGLVGGHRPENPIGWLFLGSSACFALATPAGTVAVTQQATLPLGSPRALLVCSSDRIPWDRDRPAAVPHRPPLSPRWRWLIGLTVASGLAFDAQTVLDRPHGR
jgi:hypothetical protein